MDNSLRISRVVKKTMSGFHSKCFGRSCSDCPLGETKGFVHCLTLYTLAKVDEKTKNRLMTMVKEFESMP